MNTTNIKDKLIQYYKQTCPTNSNRVKHTMDQLGALQGPNKTYSSEDIKESTDDLLNQCIGNKIPTKSISLKPIQSVCFNQLSESGCRTLPRCAWNIKTSTCVLNGRALMFQDKVNDSYRKPLNRLPQDYYPTQFAKKFENCFFWWNNLSQIHQIALGNHEDNWSLRLFEMCKPEFGIFPHTYFRFSHNQAEQISVTFQSCTNTACIAYLVVSYAQTQRKRWMHLIHEVHINRFVFGGKYEQFLYHSLDYFAKPVSPQSVLLFAEMMLEWIKQAIIFIHFFSERPHFLKYYGISSIREKIKQVSK